MRHLTAIAALALRAMQKRANLGARGGACCPSQRCARSHNQIDTRQCIALGTKYFTRQSFAVVTCYRPRDDAFADDDTESGR